MIGHRYETKHLVCYCCRRQQQPDDLHILAGEQVPLRLVNRAGNAEAERSPSEARAKPPPGRRANLALTRDAPTAATQPARRASWPAPARLLAPLACAACNNGNATTSGAGQPQRKGEPAATTRQRRGHDAATNAAASVDGEEAPISGLAENGNNSPKAAKLKIAVWFSNPYSSTMWKTSVKMRLGHFKMTK